MAALAGLLFAFQPLAGAEAQSPQRPRVQSSPAAKAKPAAKKPSATRAPAKKTAPLKPAANPRPAPPAVAPTPDEAKAPATPPGRAPVDVDVDKLKPYNLPPASREKMHQCGDEWRKLKLAGQAMGLTWRLFAEKCLPR